MYMKQSLMFWLLLSGFMEAGPKFVSCLPHPIECRAGDLLQILADRPGVGAYGIYKL
jgi:hypothetical protein